MAHKFTIAIGDIHGKSRVLQTLLKELASQYEPAESRFIFLGDLIDRGQASCRVMKDICEFFEARPSSVLVLGNHDECLRDCLLGNLDEDRASRWMWNGGDTTLKSYGIHDTDPDFGEVGQLINGAFPKHRQLLDNAVSMVVTDRHCFVHAGVDPTKALSEQDESTLRNIRGGFLDHSGPFERIIVHGHSITSTELPEVFPSRIAIDSGSYRTGRISAAIFDNDILAGFVCAEQSDESLKCRFFDATMAETATPARSAV